MSGIATTEQRTVDASQQQTTIYALGSNGAGQLGIGHVEDVSVPTIVELDISDASVKQIVAGGNHTLVLLEDGTVYSTGNDEDGRCGHGGAGSIHNMRRVNLPTAIDEGVVSHVAATWTASYFVLNDSVLVCGTGEHGELGLGRATSLSMNAQTILLPKLEGSIVQISACHSHTVILTSNGQIFGWGRGRKGQLGKPYEDVWSPRKILELAFQAESIACGVDFTCALGNPQKGEIALLRSEGRDRFEVKSAKPAAVSDWKALTASWGSIYVLLKTGKVQSWGRNDRGQLPIEDIPPLHSFAAGSEHWIAISTSEKVLTAGWSEHGNCGTPSDEFGVVKNRWNEIIVSGKAVKVFAGCATSFVVVKDT